MNWFYAQGGQQKGPVTDQELQTLVQAGTIIGTTLVWREGMADWQPYASVAAPPPPPAGPAPLESPLGTGAGTPAATEAPVSGPTALCSECGRVVAASDTVLLQGRTVCANCKPQVVQRMMEGAEAGGAAFGGGGGGPFDVEMFLAGLRARGGFQVEIGSALSRGFDLVKGNFWPCVGITALIVLIRTLAAQIPCLGLFAALLLTGPLMGGLYYYFLLQVRGRPATINEAFSGFQQPRFTQLLLASLVVQILPMIVGIVIFVPFFLGMETAIQSQHPEAFPLWMWGAFLIFFPVLLYYTLITTPGFLIIADTGLGFWDGIMLGVRLVHMRIFSFLGFMIVAWLLLMAGFVMLCVGIFWTMPVVMAASTYIWSDVLRTSEAGRAAVAGSVSS